MLALLGILPPWAWQLIIVVLRASGAINLAGALSIKLAVYLHAKLKDVKTYHDKKDFPQPFPEVLTPHNFTTGQKLEPK